MPGTWHWWTGRPREDWGKRGKKKKKTVTCSREEDIEECERGRKGASVRLGRRERYAWLCDSSYIEHSVCVDTVSCISPEEQTLPIGIAQSFLFPSLTHPQLSGTKVQALWRHASIYFLPRLWFPYNHNLATTSVLLPVPTLCDCLKHSSSVCISIFFLFLRRLNSVTLYLHEWEATIIVRAAIKHSMEDRPFAKARSLS